MFDPGMIGGILLNLGALALYYGRLQLSVLIYLVADAMWACLAYSHNEYIGTGLILIGMFVGMAVYYKSRLGIFVNNLYTKK